MTKIRFYDNDQTHIDNVKANPKIECIKVNSQIQINEKKFIPFIQAMRKAKHDIKSEYYNRFYNIYIEPTINRALKNRVNPVLNYDQTAGIQEDDMTELLHWAEKEGEVVIFDLDRTLIMTEGYGIFFKSKKECYDIFTKNLTDLMEYVGVKDDMEATIQDFIIYICGGKTRYNQLQDMFQSLFVLDIEIYINTMNEACNSPLFREVLQRIIVVPHEVQCSTEKGKLHEILASGLVDDKRSSKFEAPSAKKAKISDPGEGR